MRWLAVLLAALMLVLATAPRPAFAQAVPAPPAGKPTPADEATAKKNFESGLRLYGEGSYAEALIAFEQSYRLGGRPSALKNVAQCHRNLKHFVEAYETYEQTLAKHDAQLSGADKKAVQQALDELGVLTATVMVDVSEPDAEIEIDGKSVGRSPMKTPKRIAATGTHTLRVTKPGFTHVDQTFTVDSQQSKKIEAKLEVEKTVGRVVVREQNGRDVHVLIDGQDKGPAPWEGDVAAGEHTIEARSARFASESRKVVVAVKERLDLALDAAALQGKLRVTTVPATASITVDGKAMGTGAWEGDLAEGSHRIEVSLPGQPAQVREIVLGRGQVIVQEIPIVSAIATSALPVYEGIYVRLALFGHLATGGAPDNAVAPFTTDDGGAGGNAGLTLRIGRAWDWYGAEIVGLVGFEFRNRDYRFDETTNGVTHSSNFGDRGDGPTGFVGVGPRVTSKDDSIRFTFGIAPGVGIHSFNPRRKQDLTGNGNNPGTGGSNRFVTTGNPQGNTGGGSSEQNFNVISYTAFGFLMDGGILIGSTPGTKFYLGVQAWLDFAPTSVTGPDTQTAIPNEAFKQPGRGITASDGTQLYVGPTLGLQFGH